MPPSYPDWLPFHDHTTGTGKLYSADAGSDPNQAVWSQTIAVKANTTYQIGFFLAEISIPGSVADIDVRAGSVSLGDFAAPATQDVWQGNSLLWNSGSTTSLALSLHDLNTSLPYNDFGLDDISVQAVPEPASFAALGLGALALLRRRRR